MARGMYLFSFLPLLTPSTYFKYHIIALVHYKITRFLICSLSLYAVRQTCIFQRSSLTAASLGDMYNVSQDGVPMPPSVDLFQVLIHAVVSYSKDHWPAKHIFNAFCCYICIFHANLRLHRV